MSEQYPNVSNHFNFFRLHAIQSWRKLTFSKWLCGSSETCLQHHLKVSDLIIIIIFFYYFQSLIGNCIYFNWSKCIYYFYLSPKVKQAAIKRDIKPACSASLRFCRSLTSKQKPVSASTSSSSTRWCLRRPLARTAVLRTPEWFHKCTRDLWAWGTATLQRRTTPSVPHQLPVNLSLCHKQLWTCGDPGDQTRNRSLRGNCL